MEFLPKENSCMKAFEKLIQKEREKNFPLISSFYLLDKRISNKFESLIKINNFIKELFKYI